VEIIALKTWDSREYGLVRTGLKLTVDERYGKEMIRKGMAKLHVPPDREQPPRQIASPEGGREQPPNPPGAGQRRPGRAAGSAASTSGRRRGAGAGKP
jgi:hypothetical protein